MYNCETPADHARAWAKEDTSVVTMCVTDWDDWPTEPERLKCGPISSNTLATSINDSREWLPYTILLRLI